jgi:adenylate cyclase
MRRRRRRRRHHGAVALQIGVRHRAQFEHLRGGAVTQQVGRELGVRYVLEGSVRKAADKVRITCQLIDATTGMHLWADRYEGDLGDIFALQDEITVNVIAAITPKLLQVEIDLVARRPNDLSAHDHYLRAHPNYYSMTRDGVAEAVRLLIALEIDPRYSAASLAISATRSICCRDGASIPHSMRRRQRASSWSSASTKTIRRRWPASAGQRPSYQAMPPLLRRWSIERSRSIPIRRSRGATMDSSTSTRGSPKWRCEAMNISCALARSIHCNSASLQ